MLASTSRYRAELLERLQLRFSQIDPEFEETSRPGEDPASMCQRLAQGKASAVAARAPAGPWLVIGSDQVCHVDGTVFGKPGDFDTAAGQLHACAGRWVTFDTGLAVLSSDGRQVVTSEKYEVHFRPLSRETIERYLGLEQPFDCAGSIRAEALGVTLLDNSRGRDITTLLGLPLMLLQDVLASLGFEVLNEIN